MVTIQMKDDYPAEGSNDAISGPRTTGVVPLPEALAGGPTHHLCPEERDVPKGHIQAVSLWELNQNESPIESLFKVLGE